MIPIGLVTSTAIMFIFFVVLICNELIDRFKQGILTIPDMLAAAGATFVFGTGLGTLAFIVISISPTVAR